MTARMPRHAANHRHVTNAPELCYGVSMDQVTVYCGKGHKPRRVGIVTSEAQGLPWLRQDATAEAWTTGDLFAQPSGVNYRHRFVCPCGSDYRVRGASLYPELEARRESRGRLVIR